MLCFLFVADLPDYYTLQLCVFVCMPVSYIGIMYALIAPELDNSRSEEFMN